MKIFRIKKQHSKLWISIKSNSLLFVHYCHHINFYGLLLANFLSSPPERAANFNCTVCTNLLPFTAHTPTHGYQASLSDNENSIAMLTPTRWMKKKELEYQRKKASDRYLNIYYHWILWRCHLLILLHPRAPTTGISVFYVAVRIFRWINYVIAVESNWCVKFSRGDICIKCESARRNSSLMAFRISRLNMLADVAPSQ